MVLVMVTEDILDKNRMTLKLVQPLSNLGQSVSLGTVQKIPEQMEKTRLVLEGRKSTIDDGQ